MDYKNSEWVDVKNQLPQKADKYLCAVLIPMEGGTASRERRVIGWAYNCRLNYSWLCEDVIVTHWMPLPELPEA